MAFSYQDVLTEEDFRQLGELKAFHPEAVEEEAAKRQKPGFPHPQLVFAAADHNARMINEYQGNPIGLSNRREYLTRLVRMLQSREVDGIEGTPDILEDLLLLNRIGKQQGRPDFLQGKMMVGTINRGGLKNTVWEMDDLRSCFTVKRLADLGLDGVKFMIRINPQDERSRNTVAYCAKTVNEAAEYKLPVFIETLYVETEEDRFVMKTDTESLCKAVGVVGALGCRSVGKWLEVPLNPEYQIPVSATTCPVLVVPDEREKEALAVVREYTEQIGLHSNIRGILLGRNVMYATEDPLVLAEAIGNAWHTGATPEEAYQRAQKRVG